MAGCFTGRLMKNLFALAGAMLAFAGGASAQTIVTMEAESMTRTNYGADGTLLRIPEGSRTGTASSSFSGPAGRYNLQVQVELESDGQPTLEVYKGTTLLRKYTYPIAQNGTAASFSINDVGIASGETIKLVGRTQKQAFARI